ncbi:hypothetical protein BH11GEM1_BH11GEM1_30980 [soil metagenome]
MAVMEGEAAVQAVHGPALTKAAAEKRPLDDATQRAVDDMRADYDQQLDARYAAARGYVDAVIYPEDTRAVLALAFRTALSNPGPHLGPFVLPFLPDA